MRWALHAARMGETRNAYTVLTENRERRYPGINGRKTLK
jgi:hypothetical protein